MARAFGTQYFYQSDKLIAVKQGDQHRSLLRAGDLVIAQQQGGKPSETGLLANDDKSTVLNVQSRYETESHSFSVYGHDPLTPSPLTLSGFTGQHLQREVCAYLLGNGYRAYSPELMRFNSPDSWSPFGRGGLHAYSYCAGDPVNRSDTSGHAPTFHIKNSLWAKARAQGWESVFTENKILSKIQPRLARRDVSNLAVTSKKINTSVIKESNRIANSKISVDNILEIEDWEFNGTLASSVSTRRQDIGLHHISQLLALEATFSRSRTSDSGRRHAIFLRPGQQESSLSRQSSTDSTDSIDLLIEQNRDIRDHRRN